MNSLNKFDAVFYMENGDVFKMLFEYDNKENLIKWLSENVGTMTFLGNSNAESFINLKRVNYFEIKERVEVTA